MLLAIPSALSHAWHQEPRGFLAKDISKEMKGLRRESFGGTKVLFAYRLLETPRVICMQGPLLNGGDKIPVFTVQKAGSEYC